MIKINIDMPKTCKECRFSYEKCNGLMYGPILACNFVEYDPVWGLSRKTRHEDCPLVD